MNRILIVEDEPAIIRSLDDFLRAEGFETVSARGQQEAERALADPRVSLVLLDVSLSDGDGFGVCRMAKEAGLPVVFLTASDDESSVVRGLDMGADDYIAKPFRPRELVSRINAVMRRYSAGGGTVRLGDVIVDTEKGTVEKAGVEVSLSALEYRLLNVFINNKGKLLTRNKLLEDIWDIAGDFVNDNTLTVYIKRLRDKIETDPQHPEIIKTVRGIGYRLD